MRENSNDFLRKAKKNKNDEFYTQMIDIERELKHYRNQFKGKIVYCNCDDPTKSNFYKFFAKNFHNLGIKKLISSCYVENDINIFNFKEKNLINGFYYEYTGEKEETLIPTKDDVIFFNGDGDFRSQESIELLKSADVVVTNPPFSLFREHIDQIIKYNKEFLVIGNINAITYKNIFNLIQNNDAWMGVNMGRGISGFIVPQHYELYGTETSIDDDGNRIISTNNNL